MKRHLPDAKQVDYLVGNNGDDVTESNKNVEKYISVFPSFVKLDGPLRLTSCPLSWENIQRFCLHLRISGMRAW
jgi:hypothetical protein